MKKTLIFLLMMGICLPAIADDMPVKEDGMMFPDGRIMQPSDFDPTPEPIPEGIILPDEEIPVAPEDVKAEVAEQQPEVQAPKTKEHKQAARRRKRRANSKSEEKKPEINAPAETAPAPALTEVKDDEAPVKREYKPYSKKKRTK